MNKKPDISAGRRFNRRQFMKATSSLLALPTSMSLLGRRARAAVTGGARRVIFFYFPDGVVGPSQGGDPSQWHAYGSEYNFELPPQLVDLAPFKQHCVFLNGLTMGPTDSGSHPGGARKLLTAVDHGNGQSIDVVLGNSVGSGKPHHRVYLGAQATVNNASGDKYISHVAPGATVPPEDNPLNAFGWLLGGTVVDTGGGPSGPNPLHLRQLDILDTAWADLKGLQTRMGTADKAKLDIHLGALEEVQGKLQLLVDTPPPTEPPAAECSSLDALGITPSVLSEPEWFPKVLQVQTDLMVQAMACGQTRVGVIQGSHHTSELIMSRFEDTEMHDPNYDMRSHQASHYGATHDPNKLEFSAFEQQRRWWVQQFAYLLQQLQARPEDEGTMLDYSVVVLCSEVSDGNTHSHDNMPLVVAGGGGGMISGGRLLEHWGMRHANLWVAVAQAMGHDINSFGEWSSGPLPGLLS